MLKTIIEAFQLEDYQLNEVDESFSSTVYKCTHSHKKTVYLKMPYSSVKYQREVEAYSVLNDKKVTATLLDKMEPKQAFNGVLLLSELEGTPLSIEHAEKTAYQVGILHAKLHSVSPKVYQLKEIDNVFPNWKVFLEKQFYSFAVDVKEALDVYLYTQAVERFEQLKESLPEPDGPSFIHMDFRPANILVSNEDRVHVIDFESVRFGSTEVDFTKIYRDYLSKDRKLFESYAKGYNTKRRLPDLNKILPFYQFTDAFNSMGWCQRRGVTEHREFFEKNKTILQTCLSDEADSKIL